jgi:hypothetical protein
MAFFREATRVWLQRLEDAIDSLVVAAGSFSGPVSSTDNAVVRFNGTGGQVGQNSVVTISDGGNITVPALATVDGRDISVDGTAADAHIASTANPHSVTKTQVGLSAVTNDAQLTRAAADFASGIAQKTTPVTADRILIEDSAASFAKKYALLSALPGSSAGATRDPIWDPPTTADANDDEFTADTILSGAWTLKVGSSNPGTRDGAVDMTVSCATGHYRTTVIGSTLYIQSLKTDTLVMHKTINAATSAEWLWFCAFGLVGEYPGALHVAGMGLYRNSSGDVDNNNRGFVQTANSPTRLDVSVVLAGVTTTTTGATLDATPVAMDGVYMRVRHTSVPQSGNFYGGWWKRNGLFTSQDVGEAAPGFNLSTDRVAMTLRAGHTTDPWPLGAVSQSLVAVHFFRRMSPNGIWFAQA